MIDLISQADSSLVGQFESFKYDQAYISFGESIFDTHEEPFSWLHLYKGWLIKDYSTVQYVQLYENKIKLPHDYLVLKDAEIIDITEELEDKILVNYIKVEQYGT